MTRCFLAKPLPMRRLMAATALWMVALPLLAASPPPLALAASALEPKAIVAVARGGRAVEIDAGARERVKRGFEAVLAAARAGQPVYGLTTGVGWNKDHRALLRDGALDPDLLAASRRFNLGTLRAHAAGVGPWLPAEAVRAAMLVRLNLLLTGQGGVQPALVDQYAAFLNAGITPLVPLRGSIGEADILLTSHIGLAMAGEWQVEYRGRVMPAAEALSRAGLKPVELVGKDFLSIIGDNSLTVGRAALVVTDARRWLEREVVVFALALEGLDGNVAPFLQASVAARPRPGLVRVATQLRWALAGSDVWRPAAGRPLQDPLSFRTMPHVLGHALEAIEAVESEVRFESWHGGDNPQVVLAEAGTQADDAEETARYQVPGIGAAIVPSGNFEALPLVAALERVSLALAHAASSIGSTINRFENPEITRLSRFLTAPGNPGHGFGAVQKASAALVTEIRSLAMPVSLDEATLAGNIEDKTNNAPLTVARLQQLVDLLYPLASLQMLHAAQAVDLRPGYHQGEATAALLRRYRRHVAFVDQDRVLTADIASGADWLKGDTLE